MITRLAIAIFCLFLGNPVFAEAIKVRSGEHENFSRIVVLLPKPTDWRLEKNDLEYRLDIDLPNSRYLLNKVFNLIPRTRLIDVRQIKGTSSIVFRVAEKIEASAFALDGGEIVVDFSVSTTPDTGPVTDSREPTLTKRTQVPIELGNQYLSLFWSGVHVGAGGATPEVQPETNLPIEFNESDPRVSEAEQSILASLTRAASQGLISIESNAPDIDEIKSRKGDAQDSTTVIEPPVIPPSAGGHLAFHSQTAIDRELVSHLEQNAAGAEGAACLRDSSFDLAGWLSEEPIPAQIGTARQQLLGEFDEPYLDAVLHLARIYAALGFGAELRSLIAGYELAPEDEFPLLLISKVVDEDSLPPSPRYLELARCDGNIALWAFLAAEPETLDHINFGAVQRAFSALPVHIRALVGPRLVERLVNVGAGDVARSVRNALSRSANDPGASLDMMDAHISLADGNSKAAEDHLLKMVQADDGSSPEALIMLIEGTLDRNQPVELAQSQNAQALAFELGYTEDGIRLRRAAVLGFASIGNFDQAFSYINEWKKSEGPALLQQTSDDLFALVSKVDRDDIFLSVYFQNTGTRDTNTLPDETRLTLAQRLVEHGFPRAARDLMTQEVSDSLARQVILAKAALAEHDGSAALAHLSDVSGDEAEAIRGSAYMMLGRYSEAETSFENANQGEKALNAAWLSGDWTAVIADGNEQQKEFIERYPLQSSSSSTDQNDAEGLLTKSRRLLSDSEGARAALDALLGGDV